MAALTAILDFLFGCHHAHLSLCSPCKVRRTECAVTAERSMLTRWKPCRSSMPAAHARTHQVSNRLRSKRRDG